MQIFSIVKKIDAFEQNIRAYLTTLVIITNYCSETTPRAVFHEFRCQDYIGSLGR